jgi:hypothetical protein
MTNIREINVTISYRFLTIGVPIEDENLIASVFLGLGQYVKKGFQIKVKQAYKTFSGTQEIFTRVISRTEHIAEWGKETKDVISALRRW